MSALAQECVTA